MQLYYTSTLSWKMQSRPRILELAQNFCMVWRNSRVYADYVLIPVIYYFSYCDMQYGHKSRCAPYCYLYFKVM